MPESLRDGRADRAEYLARSAVVGLADGERAASASTADLAVDAPRHRRAGIQAVLGIYARENGQGMVFDAATTPDPEPPESDPPNPSSAKRPALKIVK